jgi:hypothetical protein
MLITADADSMTFQFYTRTDQLIDTYKIPGGPILTVTSPNGGETWQGGSIQNITWSSFATSGTVRIEYSTDNGLSWSEIASSTSDDGIESWSVPDNPTTQALIRVRDVDGNGPADQSDDVFNIIPASVLVMPLQDGVNGYGGTRDTKLLGAHLTTNYGDALTLELDGGNEVKKESALLLWDLTGISLGNTVYSVDIVLDFSNASSESYEVYKMKRAWVEDEATWNEYASGFSWEIPGADGTDDRDSIVLGAITPSPPAGLNTISLNAAGVAVVQSWIDDPTSNHGFIIMDYTNSDGATLSSREAGAVTEHPGLTVAYSPTPTILVATKVFLEGPYDYNSHTMRTDLRDNNLIPATSPYSEDPRLAPQPIPSSITDWVLVELKKVATGPPVAIRSAFLRNDGYIVADDGITEQIAINDSEGNYYIVVKHRNHLAVMSADNILLTSSSSILYDFTTSQSSAYTTGVDAMSDLGDGKFGMCSGDGNSDNGVDAIDYNTVWLPQNGTPWNYSKLGDFNLDGGIDAIDYNLHWLPNNGRASQVP